MKLIKSKMEIVIKTNENALNELITTSNHKNKLYKKFVTTKINLNHIAFLSIQNAYYNATDEQLFLLIMNIIESIHPSFTKKKMYMDFKSNYIVARSFEKNSKESLVIYPFDESILIKETKKVIVEGSKRKVQKFYEELKNNYNYSQNAEQYSKLKKELLDLKNKINKPTLIDILLKKSAKKEVELEDEILL